MQLLEQRKSILYSNIDGKILKGQIVWGMEEKRGVWVSYVNLERHGCVAPRLVSDGRIWVNIKSYTLALFLEEKKEGRKKLEGDTRKEKKSHCNAGHNHGQQVGGNMTAVKRTEETLAGQRELIEMRERKNRRREQRKGFYFRDVCWVWMGRCIA